MALKTRADGGPPNPPAFPVTCHPADMVESYGMELRDYFAAKALQGMLASGADFGHIFNMARRAYKIADAMLVERT